MIRYETVVFLQGDDYLPFEAALYPGSTAEDLAAGMLLGSADLMAAYRHLMQWEDGEARPWHSTPPWGGEAVAGFRSDGYRHPRPVHRIRRGYVMSWHTGLSHASLTRITDNP